MFGAKTTITDTIDSKSAHRVISKKEKDKFTMTNLE